MTASTELDESLSAQSAQPQAGEAVVDATSAGGWRLVPPEATDAMWEAARNQKSFGASYRAMIAAAPASAQPANPAQVTDAMVEMLAELLCSEFDEDFNPCHGYSWPEHKDDDGYRGGNAYVKLQPSDVQARAREGATRILTFLSQRKALTAAIGAGGQAAGAEAASNAQSDFDQILAESRGGIGSVLSALAAEGASEAVTYGPCGGCGNADPDKRCIGCFYPFTPTVPQPAAIGAGGQAVAPDTSSARLREALAPFARFFDFVEAAAARGLNDDETVATCGRYGTASYHAITYGHLRQARAALAAGKE